MVKSDNRLSCMLHGKQSNSWLPKLLQPQTQGSSQSTTATEATYYYLLQEKHLFYYNKLSVELTAQLKYFIAKWYYSTIKQTLKEITHSKDSVVMALSFKLINWCPNLDSAKFVSVCPHQAV